MTASQGKLHYWWSWREYKIPKAHS